MIDSRSSVPATNLGALFNAGTARSVVEKGAAQYSTPIRWAKHLARLLPNVVDTSAYHSRTSPPPDVVDWQCAGGNLLGGLPPSVRKYGVDVDGDALSSDKAFPMVSINASCTDVWATLRQLFPATKFSCQVANPPFGIKWKPTAGEDPDRYAGDSVSATWKAIQDFAAPGGFGYFLAGRNQIEALKIHEHPWAYLYQSYPVGMFPGVNLEIGVVHWMMENDGRKPRVFHHTSLAEGYHENSYDLGRVVGGLPPARIDRSLSIGIHNAFDQVRAVLEEERRGIPPFNVYVNRGVLRVEIPMRTAILRDLAKEEILRLGILNGAHPMSLVHDVATRRTLVDLTKSGFTIQPEALRLIDDALKAAECMAVPIRPVTDFERAAYVDEMDELTVRDDFVSPKDTDRTPIFRFTPGKSYPMKSGTYQFREWTKRDKLHSFADSGTRVITHEIELSGMDRFIEITDDARIIHRFMERPTIPDPNAKPTKAPVVKREHEEAWLFRIFSAPPVRTVADVAPNKVAENRARLLQIQATIAA